MNAALTFALHHVNAQSPGLADADLCLHSNHLTLEMLSI